jgi:hypothetical protein
MRTLTLLFHSLRMAFGAFAIVLLSTAAHAEIVLNCYGMQMSFGPTRRSDDSVTEHINNFGFIVDLEKKEIRWTSKFVGTASLPITAASDTEISFGDKGWNNDQILFSPKPLPDADSHYTSFGKLNRVTGELEYLSQTTWDKPNRDRNTKVGDVFGDQWKMKCAPGRRIF